MKKVSIEKIDSERLYELCASGIQQGWEEASRYVYRIISWNGWSLSPSEKEDLVQDTLLYFLSGGIKNIEEPKAFTKLLRLKALGNIIDSKRKSCGIFHVPIETNTDNEEGAPPRPQIPSDSPDPAKMIFSKQAISICREIVSSMKDARCKEILPQYFKYKAIGENIAQIAREMKKPIGTVASIIHRCLKSLYKHPRIIELRAIL